MTNDAFDDDRLLGALSTLTDPRPDEARAERTRERCHSILAARRERPGGWRAGARRWFPVFEAAAVTALTVFYLGGAVRHALFLLGR